MSSLLFSEELSLPLSIVSSKSAFLGMSGSGKSYGAGVLVERALDAGAQVVIVDTVGIWAGLRLASDGRRKGIAVPVLGGEHGDLPLAVHQGDLVARTVATSRSSMVLDVSDFTQSEVTQFVNAFATSLLHAKKRAKSPLLVVWEECQDIVPQGASKKSPHDAVVKLIKVGRNHGIGTCLISQRTAAVSKEAINLSDTIFAFRQNAPHDLASMKRWLGFVGGDERIPGDLPELPTGHCFVWSPQFLKLFKRVKVGKKRTFDSGATPDFGPAFSLAKSAPIDLGAFKASFSEAVKDAEENDPVRLRARIAEFEAKAKAPAPASNEFELADLRGANRALQALVDESVEGQTRTVGVLDEVIRRLTVLRDDVPRLRPQPESLRAPVPGESAATTKSVELTKLEQALLTAFVQHGAAPLAEATLIAGYSLSGRVYAAAKRLRELGAIDGQAEFYSATPSGEAMLGPVEKLPVGSALADWWAERLSKLERAIFGEVRAAAPFAVSLDLACKNTGFSLSGRCYAAAKHLRGLGIVVGDAQAMKLHERLVK